MHRGLIAVSDKTSIVSFAKDLSNRGVSQIFSTSSTAKELSEGGVRVTEVADYTEFPEIMGGRVKTLHPRVHGGLLGRPEDAEVMKTHGIKAIDFLVVNLYPFSKTIANPHATFEEAIENIDIGGPAMIRSAAKNHARVCVVTDPKDYDAVLSEFDANNGTISAAFRLKMAKKAFMLTGTYDALIANYLARKEIEFARTTRH